MAGSVGGVDLRIFDAASGNIVDNRINHLLPMITRTPYRNLRTRRRKTWPETLQALFLTFLFCLCSSILKHGFCGSTSLHPGLKTQASGRKT